MTPLPPAIGDYLCRRSLARRRPAYLRLDQAGIIRDGGGDLAYHDLVPLAVGQSVSTVLDFMEGLLPIDDDTCHLGCLQPQADLCIDVHIIPEDEALWVLLLDTREEERQRRSMQQKANELALMQERQARAPVSVASVEAPPLPGLKFNPRGDRREVSVLAAELRLRAEAEDRLAPPDLLEGLAAMRRRMVAGLRGDAGFLHSQTSNALVALFGLLPARGGPSEQALSAALDLLRRLVPPDDPGAVTGSLLPPAMVVTTGTAVVALETGPAVPYLQAVGPPLQAASRLLPVALPGHILTDAASFRAAVRLQAHFEPFAADQKLPVRPSDTELRISRS